MDVAEVGEDGFDVGGWWGDPYSVTLVLLTSFRVTRDVDAVLLL